LCILLVSVLVFQLKGVFCPPLQQQSTCIKNIIGGADPNIKIPHQSFNHYFAQKVVCDISEGRDPI